MIVYPMACGQGHSFEGWFASAAACEQQASDGLLTCPSCSSAQVRKLPSAPHVHTSSNGAALQTNNADAARRDAVIALRTFILANTENVGRKFAEVARRIHYQEEAARGIRGQVTPEEAVELSEEGVAAFGVSPEVIPSEEVH